MPSAVSSSSQTQQLHQVRQEQKENLENSWSRLINVMSSNGYANQLANTMGKYAQDIRSANVNVDLAQSYVRDEFSNIMSNVKPSVTYNSRADTFQLKVTLRQSFFSNQTISESSGPAKLMPFLQQVTESTEAPLRKFSNGQISFAAMAATIALNGLGNVMAGLSNNPDLQESDFQQATAGQSQNLVKDVLSKKNDPGAKEAVKALEVVSQKAQQQAQQLITLALLTRRSNLQRGAQSAA